jgi:predicted MPP superfamily phosphohydrolase
MLCAVGMNRRAFIKGGLAATAFLGGGSVYAASSLFDRHDLEVKTVRLHLGLTTPLRAAVLADIHFDPLYETGYLDHVFTQLARQSPDIVFYVGDYVSHTTARFEEFGRIAGRVRPPFGAFASMGNHDVWHGANQIRAVLEQSGIRVLRNSLVPLPANPGWALAGFDSFWAGRPNPALFSLAPAGTQFITLAHEPDAWDILADPRSRLQISGHTHGGQVRAPLVGALQLPTWGRRYDQGLFRRDEQSLYVNRGIGTVRIPYRVNCRPEITLLELT